MTSRTFSFLLLLALCGSAWADRVKDLASVAAGRSNQLIGYGLVVGLQGTGDGATVSFTTQSMKSMLSRLGVNIDGPLSDFEQGGTAGRLDIRNAAAVMITAELPGFAKPGQKNRYQRVGHRSRHQPARGQLADDQPAGCGR